MIVGFDFDNTIISYEKLFKKIAYKKKLVPKNIKPNKSSVKEYLVKKNREREWTILQGEVYGTHIMHAKIYAGVKKVMKSLSKNRIKFYIISHKTKFPYRGKKVNLHLAARKWIYKNIIVKDNSINFSKKDIFFEESIKEKISRIKKLKCNIYVDDLIKILDLLPKSVIKVLFDYNQKNKKKRSIVIIKKWTELNKIIKN
mgnify:CR=1 FL=1|tara:strand:- start:22183 stop:22782 length:600 start_codon:yes stop_codon:yes gene_type:complete